MILLFGSVVTINSSPLTSELNSISALDSRRLSLHNSVAGMVSRFVLVGLIYLRHSNELVVSIVSPFVTSLRLLSGSIPYRVSVSATNYVHSQIVFI